MAIKFNKKIRLWKSGKNSESAGIGINFGKSSSKNRNEMNQVYNAIESILTLKYGKGVK